MQLIKNNASEYLRDLINVNENGTTIHTRAYFDHCLLCVPQLVKCVFFHYSNDHLCTLIRHYGMTLI